jgi:ABC-type sulfate/molybdate transport systems ATPase subunit
MSIEIRNVSKQFGSFQALRDVSLDIQSGELIALLGPSGCGKTTLLRIIAGLESPDVGSIHFSGEDTTDVHVRERNVGFVFQHYALFRHMTVFENVAFGLRIKPRKELRRWLRRLHDELHVTSIFVTHDQEEALEVADRVVVINQGKIEQSGSPQEVWENPASPFVYGFLGDVNLFHGRANEGLVHMSGIEVDAPEADDAKNAKAFAYVRPHDLDVERYSPGQNMDAQGRPRGIVARLERAIVVGPIARLELIPADDNHSTTQNGEDALIEAQIPAHQFKEMGFKEGETLVVTPRRTRVFIDQAAGI